MTQYAETRAGKQIHTVALNTGDTYKMACGMERTRSELSSVTERSERPHVLLSCYKCYTR